MSVVANVWRSSTHRDCVQYSIDDTVPWLGLDHRQPQASSLGCQPLTKQPFGAGFAPKIVFGHVIDAPVTPHHFIQKFVFTRLYDENGMDESSVGTGLDRWPSQQRRQNPIALDIGRDAQRSALSRAFEHVGGGQDQTQLVTGEAGIGKSHLVAEAKAMANRQGWLILEGHCFEPDSILPYAPLIDVLGTFLSGLLPAEAVELFGSEARDLLKILPELAHWIPALTPVSTLDPTQERCLAIQGIHTVLTRLAS